MLVIPVLRHVPRGNRPTSSGKLVPHALDVVPHDRRPSHGDRPAAGLAAVVRADPHLVEFLLGEPPQPQRPTGWDGNLGVEGNDAGGVRVDDRESLETVKASQSQGQPETGIGAGVGEGEMADGRGPVLGEADGAHEGAEVVRGDIEEICGRVIEPGAVRDDGKC